MPDNICPKCRVGTLTDSGNVQQDTDNEPVCVWGCSNCDYTEGQMRPGDPRLQDNNDRYVGMRR